MVGCTAAGHIAGWQLLAQSVQPGDADTLSSGGRAPGSDQQHVHSKPASSRAKHMRSLSNLSRTSSMSDDSGLGPAAASVTPRPHQWLYKEYKIQDEIGSGGFGRVCRYEAVAVAAVIASKQLDSEGILQCFCKWHAVAMGHSQQQSMKHRASAMLGSHCMRINHTAPSPLTATVQYLSTQCLLLHGVHLLTSHCLQGPAPD